PDHSRAGAALVGVPGVHAVVHDRPLRRVHTDVAGAVELRLNLPDLGRHELVVVDERVLAEGTTGWRSGNAHLPPARSEGRRLPVVVLPNGDRLVLLDRRQGPRDVRGVTGVVRRPRAVVGAPLGRRPL